MSGDTALLLIDLQHDYLARAGLTPDRATLIANAAAALAAARARHIPIFHVRTDGSEPMPHRREAPEVVAGTEGAEPPTELAAAPGEPVFTKRFFSAFDAPGLDDALREGGITRLLIAGVQGHACIHATALDGYARGYALTLLDDCIASDDPALAAQMGDWLAGRAASPGSSATLIGAAPATTVWQHPNPCNTREMLSEVAFASPAEVNAAAARLTSAQPELAAMPAIERSAALQRWREALAADRERWIAALVRDVAKPRRDAEGEFAYALALLDHVAATIVDEEQGDGRAVFYRPHGLVGLITPWNNPFAIPIGKLAPALAYGNAVVWKPALPGSAIATMLAASLAEVGLGRFSTMVAGDAGTGRALLDRVDALSFTGSVPVGRQLVRLAARRMIPVQAELGGSNAVIVDCSADLAEAARDLAAAAFSFSGQRCTAIRRIILVEEIADAFTALLQTEVARLAIGDPADAATAIGPLIDRRSQQAMLGVAKRGTLLAGGAVPVGVSADGCWLEPTLLTDLDDDHPLLMGEVFGPLAAVVRAHNFDQAIALHNRSAFGLVGALYSADPANQARFLDQAQAGMLSIGRARPALSAAGPFVGWKASAYGAPEHGRWNREAYTRPQAIYRG